ncbi:MAG: hypothetical protein LPJ96_07125 [Exiguobacterium sp.]|uniref:hypothetical protein n=1 Tax=Exiguobacterium TaxID=33986 RepID=UPI001BE7EADB|nr:hypothetical protein [Exiguobacterium sp. s150]MDX5323366.1 hypothetical protein [Exiguobacterium sp.]MDX5425160.1 hypothetical protein [Exiguobacterium sp.]MDX6772580.1 hypothetical protein [Exiguobacterium sp.]
MRRSRTSWFGRMVRGVVVSVLALSLMAVGVFGFLFFTVTGNDWLGQWMSYGSELSLQADGFESRVERWTDSLEARVGQLIPETIRPFFD